MVSGERDITCFQEDVTLDGSASNQGANFSYAWYDANGSLLSTEIQYITNQPGIYVFEVTDIINDCNSTQEITVRDIRNNPEANILSTITSLTCDNNMLQLSADTVTNVMYTWQHLITGDNFATKDITIMQPGLIQLQVQDTITGCTDIEMIMITADTVVPQILLTDPGLINCQNGSVTIDASASDDGQFQWLDSNLDSLQESTTVLQTEIAGTYYFSLENIVNGCEAIDSVVVMSNLSTPQINLDDEASLTCNQNSISVEGTIISANDFETKWLLNQEIIGNGTSQDLSLIHI